MTRPSVNTLEDPLTEARVLESIPPVQDSATAILRFFLLSILIIWVNFSFIYVAINKGIEINIVVQIPATMSSNNIPKLFLYF